MGRSFLCTKSMMDWVSSTGCAMSTISHGGDGGGEAERGEMLPTRSPPGSTPVGLSAPLPLLQSPPLLRTLPLPLSQLRELRAGLQVRAGGPVQRPPQGGAADIIPTLLGCLVGCARVTGQPPSLLLMPVRSAALSCACCACCGVAALLRRRLS